MKRIDAIDKIDRIIRDLTATHKLNGEVFLKMIEELGMAPPNLPTDHCQVMINTFIDPNFNIWEEDFEKNEKLVEALKRRLQLKKERGTK